MPVILASLIFAISLSLLPYTESQEYESEEEMQRLKAEYLARIRKRTVRKAGMLDRINSACMAEMNGNESDQNKTLCSGIISISNKRVGTLRPAPKRSASLPQTPYSRSARRLTINGLAKEV